MKIEMPEGRGEATHEIKLVLLLFVFAVLVELFKARGVSAPVLDDRCHPQVDETMRRDRGDQGPERMPLRRTASMGSVSSLSRVWLSLGRAHPVLKTPNILKRMEDSRLGLRTSLSVLRGS